LILHDEWVPEAGGVAAARGQYARSCDKLDKTHITIGLSVGICLAVALIAVGVVSIAVRVSAITRVLVVVVIVVSHIWAGAQLMRE
jgi:hypothetical protein